MIGDGIPTWCQISVRLKLDAQPYTTLGNSTKNSGRHFAWNRSAASAYAKPSENKSIPIPNTLFANVSSPCEWYVEKAIHAVLTFTVCGMVQARCCLLRNAHNGRRESEVTHKRSDAANVTYPRTWCVFSSLGVAMLGRPDTLVYWQRV